VAVGIAARRTGAVGVAALQLVSLAAAVTALFTGSGVLVAVPGPAAVAELGALVAQAGDEIRTGVPPVPATSAMLLLVTVAFGITAVAVHAVVGAGAPAAAGVLLLAVFAVPTALADDLLPAWMPAVAAAGFGLLLLTGTGGPRRGWYAAAGGAGLTAAAVALALGIGAAAGAVGTAGRLPESGSGLGRGGEIGLNPFTSLRGQLQQSEPTELFQVAGLPRPAYLRALTLSSYVPDAGWQLSRPGSGVPLSGALPAADVPGDRAQVQVDNIGFRDYWLPVYGVPLGVVGTADDRWAFDPVSGTAYSTRPRQERGWMQDALLPAPTAEALRAAGGGEPAAGADPAFLATDGVDPRVAALAAEVTAGARTGFDRAVALNQWFTGPDSAFTYDLSTAPGNGDDALVEFLTHGRRGYCEQFASAMAVMLRTVGVPSRVAVGFTGGRATDEGRSVSTSDAHAWVEAWFPGIGWTTFDPTPLTDGRALVPPYVAEALGEAAQGADQATAQPEQQETAAAPEPAPATDTPEAVPDDPQLTPEPPAEPPVSPSGFGTAVLLALAAAGAVALGAAPAAWRARERQRRLTIAAAGGPRAAGAAWAELLAESADRGVTTAPSDTVRGAAERLARAHAFDHDACRALQVVVDAVEESWYGGIEPDAGALAGPVAAAQTAIRAGCPLTLRARLLPPSTVSAVRAAVGPRAERDDTAAARR
jgi:hypothetical protein